MDSGGGSGCLEVLPPFLSDLWGFYYCFDTKILASTTMHPTSASFMRRIHVHGSWRGGGGELGRCGEKDFARKRFCSVF